MNYLFYSAYCCPLVTSVLVEIIWNHSISACWIFPHTNYAYTLIILHVPCNLFTNYYLLPVPRETTYTQPSVLFVNVWSQQSSGDDITVGWFSKLLRHSWPRHCTSVNFLPPQPHVHMSAHIHVFTGGGGGLQSTSMCGWREHKHNATEIHQWPITFSFSHTHTYKAMRLLAPHESASCLTA